MRWATCLCASLLSFNALASPPQLPLRPPDLVHDTLASALGRDPDYTLLIKLLQRARLIPTLNKLNGSTFFAPTNDAIKRRADSDSLWTDALNDDPHTSDNVHEQLRQELFYHLLNYSIPSLPTLQDPTVEKTLHYPRQPLENPSPEPPPSPPWMPIPGGTLGGEPQRLRLSSRDAKAWVGVDAFGNGGVEIVKGVVDAGNGILLGINRVLDVPPDLATVVSQHKSVAYFHQVMNAELSSFLNNTSGMTLFLPVDSAWDELDPLERLYLESDYATDDLYRILNMHAVLNQGVSWSESFKPGLNLSTIAGHELKIVYTPEDNKVLISDSELIEPDIYASNGVIHTVSSLLIPPNTLEITPEKYLLALNCTQFVQLVHSVDLTHLINNTESDYTILAPTDDIMKVFEADDLPPPGSDELKRLLEYHFIPKKWTPEKLKDGMLLKTALKDVGLGYERQVLPVEVNESGKKDKVERSVRFGGAGVIGEAIEKNNMLVYFISRPLTPPVDALQTALPSLDLSTFLAAVFSTNLADWLKTTPKTTLLIPHNSAFTRVGGLVSAYLLTESSKTDLKRVIMHHVLDGVSYASKLVNGSEATFATLEGSDLRLDRLSNGTVHISPSGGWPGMRAELLAEPRDLLTRTGAVHSVSDLLLPRSVALTRAKLVRAAKGSIFATMLNKTGMDWILEGTAPPANSSWSDKDKDGAAWTLLCPTDDAFKGVNLTTLYADVKQLTEIVEQHIVPAPATSAKDVLDVLANNRPLPLSDQATFSTLRSPGNAYGDLVFRAVEGSAGGQFIVGIQGARGTPADDDWARVLAWGRASASAPAEEGDVGVSRQGGGVIQIDRLLMPYHPRWYIEYFAPLVVGFLGVGLIGAFFMGVRWVWRKDLSEATYEPAGGFGNGRAQDEDDE